jgi:hypothetical protein
MSSCPTKAVIALSCRTISAQVLSSDTLLMILIRPVITNHPVSQTVLQGGTATFTVLAGPDRPSAPLSYRWLRNSAAFLTSAVPVLVLTMCNPTRPYEFQ